MQRLVITDDLSMGPARALDGRPYSYMSAEVPETGSATPLVNVAANTSQNGGYVRAHRGIRRPNPRDRT